MSDTRWHDPKRTPLSNGPFRAVTPPGTPKVRLINDGQLVEYLLPYPMHIIDNAAWSPVKCRLTNRPVEIWKPIPVNQSFEPEERAGNELPDAFCSIVRVFTAADAHAEFPTPGEMWPLVESLLSWVRVKARHYWLLHGVTGFASLFRGSIFTQYGNRIDQRNFATYGPNLVVRPLSRELWNTLSDEVA